MCVITSVHLEIIKCISAIDSYFLLFIAYKQKLHNKKKCVQHISYYDSFEWNFNQKKNNHFVLLLLFFSMKNFSIEKHQQQTKLCIVGFVLRHRINGSCRLDNSFLPDFRLWNQIYCAVQYCSSDEQNPNGRNEEKKCSV